MARAVARLDRFTWKGAGFDAWLFGILRHVVLDTQRSRGRRKTAGLVDQPSVERGPLDRVLHAEEAAAMRTAFGRLSPSDREVLELRVVAGLSSDAVAEVLGKKPGAVRMAQARALDRLRSLLEEAG